jgi:hypothetical protein
MSFKFCKISIIHCSIIILQLLHSFVFILVMSLMNHVLFQLAYSTRTWLPFKIGNPVIKLIQNRSSIWYLRLSLRRCLIFWHFFILFLLNRFKYLLFLLNFILFRHCFVQKEWMLILPFLSRKCLTCCS